MRPIPRGSMSGFSLIESVISLALGLILLTTVLATWHFSTREWKSENAVSQMRYQSNAAIERIRQDARLADSSKILFYPSTATSYTAISLPQASPNASGLLTFSSGAIAWSRTVIYHVYTNGSRQELRRTVYSSFNASTTARQAQLDSVAESGSGGAGSTTEVLLSADSVDLELNSSTPVFDGYDSSVSLSELSDFGSVRIGSGTHEIKFLASGKNASSSNYKIGVDAVTVTPSGGTREAEELTVSATSGDSLATVDMSAYTGAWGGNTQIEYGANAIGDYLTLQFDYDRWLESNFADMTHDQSTVTTTGDPYLALATRETQGLAPAWSPDMQANGATSEDESVSTTDKSIRVVLQGGIFNRPSTMLRIKFKASSTQPLKIERAYFGPQGGSGAANFDAAPAQLYFDNTPETEGAVDPTGALAPGTATSITIPAGKYAWTNWFEYATNPASPQNYLVSFYVDTTSAMLRWDDSAALPTPVHSYQVDGDHAVDTGDWTLLTNFTSSPMIRAVSAVAAWESTAVATSQIYDTKVAAPSYNQISWDSSTPGGSSVFLKVRSSSSAAMVGAADWSTLSARASSPSSLSSLASNRYVQFQATLQASSPYTAFPSIDNVSIDWPGQTTFVTIGGKFTRGPDYGTFQVLVDDTALVKAMTVSLSAETQYRGQAYTESITAEVKAKNTGK